MTQASQRMSAMALELAESPAAVRAGASDNDALRNAFFQLKARFERKPPSLIVLCGRGSSGHACVFLRYLIETKLGVPTALCAPSVVTAYGARPRLQDAWFLTITQSGGSPDLAAAMRAARKSGALSLALVNVERSAVAEEAQIVLPLRAGPERSVAATKTVIASMALGARIVAMLGEDGDLSRALDALPHRLERALACDWSAMCERLAQARRIYVIGRGAGFAIAGEIALKMAEVLRAPALVYSAAELLHGPRAAIGKDDLVLALTVQDATLSSVSAVAHALGRAGVDVLQIGDGGLPFIAPDHPFTDAIAMLAPAYGALELCARRLGFDPDRPPHLTKITQTM